MPDSLHPPYAPTAIYQPRLLVRWLDINAQNGPLGRTKAFITLPAFSVPVSWQGFSDIVASFNFEGPRNFSLTSLVCEIPPVANYMLCVQYTDTDGTSYRYALWRDVGEVIYFDLEDYTSQPIRQNFRLEVWSTNSTPAVNVAPLILYTSCLGALDYRYGQDFTLVSSDVVNTLFTISSTAPVLPANIDIVFHVDSLNGLVSSGGNLVSWTDYVGGLELLPTGSPIVTPSGLPLGCNCVGFTANTQYVSCVTPQFGINVLVFVAQMMSDTGGNNYIFSAFNQGLTLFWTNGTSNASANTAQIGSLAYDEWYTFVVWNYSGFVNLSVYSLATGILVATNQSLMPVLGYTLQCLIGNAGMWVVEAIMGSGGLSGSDPQSVATYMTAKYFNSDNTVFTLPFTFPAGSVSKQNTKTTPWLTWAKNAPGQLIQTPGNPFTPPNWFVN